MGLAQWWLDPGPQYSGRIFLWGVAIGPRRHMSISQNFLNPGYPIGHASLYTFFRVSNYR